MNMNLNQLAMLQKAKTALDRFRAGSLTVEYRKKYSQVA